MHTKSFAIWCALGTLFVGVGCGSSDNAKVIQDSAEISDADARQQALTYAPGTGGAVEKIETADEHRWAVTVALSGGSEVVVELERTDGRLDEISGHAGPFDYELPAVAAGFMTYAKAREMAVAAKPGALEAWEQKVANGIWEFYTRDNSGKLWEIKLNAQTGATISTIQKDTPD